VWTGKWLQKSRRSVFRVTQSRKEAENFVNTALRFSSLARETLHKTFVSFWGVKFSSGGLGASHLYSDSISRKAKVTQQISMSYHMCTVGQSASSGRFFIGQKVSTDLEDYLQVFCLVIKRPTYEITEI
jgi:hypothetical protein